MKCPDPESERAAALSIEELVRRMDSDQLDHALDVFGHPRSDEELSGALPGWDTRPLTGEIDDGERRRYFDCRHCGYRHFDDPGARCIGCRLRTWRSPPITVNGKGLPRREVRPAQVPRNARHWRWRNDEPGGDVEVVLDQLDQGPGRRARSAPGGAAARQAPSNRPRRGSRQPSSAKRRAKTRTRSCDSRQERME